MFGRLIIALLMIGAAAVVTMERETAVVADVSAELAESKYADAEERAKRWEARAGESEAKVADLEIRNRWLEGELAEAQRLRELALLPLEVKLADGSMKGDLPRDELLRVATLNAATTSACFARAPERGPSITLRWIVRVDGRVTNVMSTLPPPGYEEVVSCLSSEIVGWRFKASNQGLTLAQATWRTSSPKGP